MPHLNYLANYNVQQRLTAAMPLCEGSRGARAPAGRLHAQPAEPKALRRPSILSRGRQLFLRAIQFVRLYTAPLLERLTGSKPAAQATPTTAPPPVALTRQAFNRELLRCSFKGLAGGPDKAAIDGPALKAQEMATIQSLRKVATGLHGICRIDVSALPAAQQAEMERLGLGAALVLGMKAGGIPWTEWATTNSQQVAAFSATADEKAWDRAAMRLKSTLAQATALQQQLQRVLGSDAPAVGA